MIFLAATLGILGILLSAIFSGCETGFYRATRLRLVLDAMGGGRVALGLLFLINHPALFVATCLIGSSIANYMISLGTVMALSELLPQVHEVAEIVATLFLSPVVLVFGEMLPKNLFLQAPNQLLRRCGPLFLFFVVVLLPLSSLLWLLGRLLGRLSRTSREPVRLVLAQRELRHILAEGHDAGILHSAQQSLAHGILAVARKPVTQFLTPPGQLLSVRADMSRESVLRLAERRHMPVMPVAAVATGQLVGYVRVVDLRLQEGSRLTPIHPLPEVRDDSSHLAALMKLESTGESLVRVTNAHGDTVGIVTLERLREPLF